MTNPTNIVKRVSLAVRKSRYERRGVLEFYDEAVPLEEDEILDAQAAIGAMREPTAAMASPMNKLNEIDWLEMTAEDVWQAMIDEALADD